jgi:hypothetical protein
MGRRISRSTQQDQLERITRLQCAIAQLETYQDFFEGQGELAPSGTWVARYQVRQPKKVYWYYKLQADQAIFTKSSPALGLSKYKHLGKGGSQAHVDGVMGVVRRTMVEQLQKTIDSLKGSLLDISFDAEQEDK